MSGAALFWGLLFGAVGAGYCLYGRKQRLIIPFLCGAALMVAPCIVENTVLLVAACVALVAAPFLIRP